MPGPKKQPAKLTAIKGTAQPCRESGPALEVDPLTEIPEAPEWMDGGLARRTWDQRARSLVGLGILAEQDVPFLAHFCQLEAKLAKLWQAGETPVASMLTQYVKMASELSLTPASRQKFKQPEAGKPGNKFANVGKK